MYYARLRGLCKNWLKYYNRIQTFPNRTVRVHKLGGCVYVEGAVRHVEDDDCIFPISSLEMFQSCDWQRYFCFLQYQQHSSGSSILNKKRSERRKHCALAVGQKFSPRRIPLPGGAERPKFNQLEMVPSTFTYRPSLVKIDVRNFELSW